MSVPRSRRIAVLFDHIESDYHLDVLGGVLRAARATRSRTLVIPGGWLEPSAEQRVPRNFVYDLVAQAPIDGLLILAGSLSNYVGAERFREWVRRFEHLPSVFVGIDLGELPSVFVDNEAGVALAVSHMIEKHDRRRLAFIAGPNGSAECAARRRGYEAALSAHGIALDARFVVPGGLERDHGRHAIGELFDERRFSPATLDAVIAVNDESALGALEELTRRGVAVPEAIAVVGFDDSVSARASNPPLTTVAQRVELQAYSAARLLLAHLDDGAPLDSSALEPELVVRSSCGCPSRFVNDSRAVKEPKGGMARTCRLALVERRSMILAELARAAAGRLVGMSGWEARLLDALVQDLAGDPGSFFFEVEQLVRKNVALGSDVMLCHEVLTVLRLQALACASLEPASRPRVEDLFQESRLIIARIGVDVEREQHRALGSRLRSITKACLASLGAPDDSALARTLASQLPALGIKSYCVSRFTRGPGPSPELAVVARRAEGVGAAPHTLPSRELGLDPALLLEEALVIEPLEFRGEPVGLAALAWGAREALHYEQLRELLGPAIHVERGKLEQ
jgi:DNA-binding LacI/PurR family transcriptional regulator